MKKTNTMIIYNLFPLLAGPVTQWEKHFTRIKEMGFNWIFINPIQKPGYSGSLYSISDYFDFNPLIVDSTSSANALEQIKAMNLAARRQGLSIMIDLVINHCAFDSNLIKEHPEWFKHEDDGNISHPFCMENGHKTVWGDLAQFNHRGSSDKEGLYSYFLKIISFMIEAGFSGFRCDAAYHVPSSMWKKLIRETKKTKKDCLFFAETLGCPPDQTRKTARAGFDYIFNSSKWWDFNGHWLMEQYNLTREIAPSISFPESHDTLRLCEEAHGNIQEIRQRYLFAALFSGGVMTTAGFEFGFVRKPHVVKSRPEDWESTDIDLTDFIASVNRLKAAHPIFQEDAPTQILHQDNSKILLMWKGSLTSNEEALIILNKDVWNKQTFSTERMQQYVQAGAELRDVSPEHALDYIPEPFSYDLRPGQALVFITTRDKIAD